MAVITISRQLGSFGEEIATAVADKLNYEYIHKQKIGEALAGHGFRASDFKKYDEKKPSIWQSLLEQTRNFQSLLRAVIYDFAIKENTVIVGRGGQILLKDLPGVLHMRIIAPFKTRMNRLMAEGYEEKNAERALRQRDRDSSGYIYSFFGANWDDAELYDLVLNTKSISSDTGIKLILDTLDSREFKEIPKETTEKLGDLALTHKVETAIMEIPGLSWANLYVDKGVANISGTANSDSTIVECKRIVSGIQGIKSVDSQLFVKRDLGD
ncbi:MAG: cytidylate kinase family protein [Deltaproteobacteria bacterium]|nr:cytidylate kinase family protein [Deltaproteobacteria bacterium]